MFAIPFPAIDPVALSLGPVVVRWYALAYIAGILLGWAYCVRLVGRETLWGGTPPFGRAELEDFVLWLTIGIVLGGRIGYVLFYNPSHYLANPADIVKVWQGGMAFHGGMLGVVAAIVLFARRSGVSPLSLADVVSAAAPIGLFFGRIANFVNGELWGRPTDLPWGVVFPEQNVWPVQESVARHPSQLYEALLEGVVLFLILRVLTHRYGALERPGLVTGAFLAGYGAFRFMIEFVREPDVQIGFLAGWLTMGMLLSLPMVAAGAGLLVWVRRR